MTCGLRLQLFGVGLKDRSLVSVAVLPSDTPAQIKMKLVNAIIAEATTLGYSVVAADIVLPAYQRGN